ncbi:endonuclease/exonuclease/phosphatase family protein [Enterovirga rhinocerotis]|uniref:Endonuclease/exonuclease/phosphatase family metal-dependent hydrolase n=1 Tax=Enterovirga rhinocerotis TaxID=1339210 RepID=A0A4R7C527_9HYPH|nr:endonuclease/exonuclease/phosphatase family protein [Enterovirga rhinocerotis]TDR93644.1 endonuclease/exonuclease/phosphatase family metal-dependent hydrolase [Enterovirga rhinocerotis]
MKLLTWNIQWGLGLDGRVDLARIVRHARDLGDPDILCLQEVADNMPDLEGQGGADQFAELAALLPDHRPVIGAGVETYDEDGRRRRFGNLILSRLPVRQVIRHALPWPGTPGLNMPRTLIETMIEAPFGPVRVMTTHLEYFSGDLRALAVDAIRAAHEDGASRAVTLRETGAGPYAPTPASGSAILTGDFNMRPDDPTRMRLLAPFPDGTPAFRDAWVLRHGDVPHPPSFCIADRRYGEPHCADHVLVTGDLARRVAAIAYDTETRLSDHQPVLLTID